MLILVTGGSGFIGSHVVDKLVDADHKVRVFDTRAPHRADVEFVEGNITELDEVWAAVAGTDVVYHFAAAANVDLVKAHPVETVETNVMGTVNVLEAARAAGVGRVVFASSTYLFDEGGHLYSTTKLAGELLCRDFATLYGLSYTNLRLGTAYGPRSREVDVISIFVRNALEGRPLEVRGAGAQRRNFVYVEDLARGAVAALSERARGNTYMLGGAVPITIRELAELVQEVAGTNVEIRVTAAAREDDYPGRSGDLTVTHADLGWWPATSLRDGIAKYIEWRQMVGGAGAQGRDAAAGGRGGPGR